MEVKMKKKNIFLIALTMILCFTLLVSSAWARRHRGWEGAAVFLGTAFLIDAFVHAANRNCAYDRYYCPPAGKGMIRSHRHYRLKRIWVAPFTERIWHEGYYNRYGRWVPGHWELIHRPGHWR